MFWRTGPRRLTSRRLEHQLRMKIAKTTFPFYRILKSVRKSGAKVPPEIQEPHFGDRYFNVFLSLAAGVTGNPNRVAHGHEWPPVVFQHPGIHPSETFKGPSGNILKPFSDAR